MYTSHFVLQSIWFCKDMRNWKGQFFHIFGKCFWSQSWAAPIGHNVAPVRSFNGVVRPTESQWVWITFLGVLTFWDQQCFTGVVRPIMWQWVRLFEAARERPSSRVTLGFVDPRRSRGRPPEIRECHKEIPMQLLSWSILVTWRLPLTTLATSQSILST